MARGRMAGSISSERCRGKGFSRFRPEEDWAINQNFRMTAVCSLVIRTDIRRNVEKS